MVSAAVGELSMRMRWKLLTAEAAGFGVSLDMWSSRQAVLFGGEVGRGGSVGYPARSLS